jgi:C4-dicarboxylate-specific signal transduction histidine kinase
MTDSQKQYIDLLNQKLDALTKIFDITKNAVFTGEEEHFEQEAENFAALYEKRANIIARIEKIEVRLSAIAKDCAIDDKSSKNKEFTKARKTIKDKATTIRDDILALDKNNTEISQKLMNFLKGGMKKLRDGKDISSKYVDAYQQYSTAGYYVDRKN